MSKIWSPEDMAKLANMVSADVPWRVIGAHFNRSGNAVQMKAASMGLGAKPYSGNKSPVWSLIVKICADGRPRTVFQLMALTAASRVCIDRLMKERHQAGLAHVAGWKKNAKGPATPFWLPVPGKDAVRPRARTEAQRQRDRMHRMKDEDPLRYKAILDRTTIRRRLRDGVVTPQHPVLQALFGMGTPA